MYQGKERVKAIHFKLPSKAGDCPELVEMLSDRRFNVLSVHYSQNGHNEKWALVIYEEL